MSALVYFISGFNIAWFLNHPSEKIYAIIAVIAALIGLICLATEDN